MPSVDLLLETLSQRPVYDEASVQTISDFEDAMMTLENEDVKNFAATVLEKLDCAEVSNGDILIIAKSLSRLDGLLHPPETTEKESARLDAWHAWMTHHKGRLPSLHRVVGADEDEFQVSMEKELFAEMADWLCGKKDFNESYRVKLRDFVNFQALAQTFTSNKRKRA